MKTQLKLYEIKTEMLWQDETGLHFDVTCNFPLWSQEIMYGFTLTLQ